MSSCAWLSGLHGFRQLPAVQFCQKQNEMLQLTDNEQKITGNEQKITEHHQTITRKITKNEQRSRWSQGARELPRTVRPRNCCKQTTCTVDAPTTCH